MLIPQPITLTGPTVQLKPIAWAHLAVLTDLGSDEDLWRWTTTAGNSPSLMRAYVDEALTLQARGTALPFVTVDRASGRLVGSTRFGNINVPNARLDPDGRG